MGLERDSGRYRDMESRRLLRRRGKGKIRILRWLLYSGDLLLGNWARRL